MPRDSRALILRPSWGTMRQGTIFSGAVAHAYDECETWGIVITARCDLKQEKVPLVNYVPVVRFADWLRREYAQLLARRNEKDALGRLGDLISAEGHAPSVLTTIPIDTVVDTLFPQGAQGKSATRGAKAREAVAAVQLCRACRDQPAVPTRELQDLEDLNRKGASKLREECLRHKLTAHHFLSHIEADGLHEGFVVLLRQVYHLPYELAARVADGLELPHESVPQLLATSGFAAPLGELNSPYLEQLMQRFAMLFSRIGVPDVGEDFERQFVTKVGRGV